MKKEYLLAAVSTAIALVVALGLIRWLAPELLGGRPADQRLVRESKEVPPFYQNVFRIEDFRSDRFLINDPVTLVRGHPFLPEGPGAGPHDALGFRNRAIPATADVVVIGDSQTYGNNVSVEENWPGQLAGLLGDKAPVVYSMATGGWAAVQYLEMLAYSRQFRPRVLMVAFHSGNDALESFRVAYETERWRYLRPDPRLSGSDYPSFVFPPPESEWWKVRFPDGLATVFTPKIRLISNDPDLPAVRAGYAVMEKAAREMAEGARQLGVPVVMTIIPTKELCYAPRLARDRLVPPPAFDSLVAAESAHIERLAGILRSLPGVAYVDLVGPLQQAALGSVPLYPEDINGHPVQAGYGVIAAALAPAVDARLPARPRGLVATEAPGGAQALFVVNGHEAWRLASPQVAIDSGWKAGPVPVVQERDIATLPILGLATAADPKRLGPRR